MRVVILAVCGLLSGCAQTADEDAQFIQSLNSNPMWCAGLAGLSDNDPQLAARECSLLAEQASANKEPFGREQWRQNQQKILATIKPTVGLSAKEKAKTLKENDLKIQALIEMTKTQIEYEHRQEARLENIKDNLDVIRMNRLADEQNRQLQEQNRQLQEINNNLFFLRN